MNVRHPMGVLHSFSIKTFTITASLILILVHLFFVVKIVSFLDCCQIFMTASLPCSFFEFMYVLVFSSSRH